MNWCGASCAECSTRRPGAAKLKLGPADAVAKTIVAAVAARKPKRRYLAGSGVAIFAVLAYLPTSLRERLIKTTFGLA